MFAAAAHATWRFFAEAADEFFGIVVCMGG